MPGLRNCKYCEGMDKEENMTQYNRDWVHKECKVKYMINIAKEDIGDEEDEYKAFLYAKGRGDIIAWLDNQSDSSIEDAKWELRKQWTREAKEEVKKIYDYLVFEVREFDGHPIYIDQSVSTCDKCGEAITDDGRIPDSSKKHICRAIIKLKKNGFTNMDDIVKAILELNDKISK